MGANSRLTQIIGGKILTPQGWIENGSLLMRDSRILAIQTDPAAYPDALIYDAQGCFVLPGSIDTHIHGGGGHDFMEGTETAFRAIIAAHQRYGTTALYPTLAASSFEMIRQAVATTEKLMAEADSPVLGLHLEGPYLNPAMAGGQMPEFICNPDSSEYLPLLDQTGCIRRWDASPELPGALQFAKTVSCRGILAGIAHTQADYPLVQAACEAGFAHVTHFYNAMTAVHKSGAYKKEGTVEAVYLTDQLPVEIIADGIHLPPALLKLVHKLKGVEKTVLVTDAMACAAYPGSKAYDPRVIIEDDVCKLADGSALAGSIATMDRTIRTMVQQAGVPLEDAVCMASETPARLMQVFHRKGSLQAGKDADIQLMNSELQIQAVWAMGNPVYSGL